MKLDCIHKIRRVVLRGWILLVTVVLIGCSKDESGRGVDAPAPIEFSAENPTPFITRTTINSTSDLQTAGFGVLAYSTGNTPWESAKTTATPNFMYNQKVYTSSWTYSPVKYWPNDNNPADGSGAEGSQTKSYLSFFAYAPHDGTGIALSNNTTAGAPTITYTWGQENDLLYAAPQLDRYKYDSNDANDNGRVGDVVSFTFQHALAKVVFKVRRASGTGLAVTLKSLSISGFHTGGTFNLGSSSWSSTSGDDGSLSLRSTDLSVTSTDGLDIGSSLLIPGSSLSYTISYTIGAKNYNHAGISLTPTSISSLNMGLQYTIIFTIDGDAVMVIVDTSKYTEQW